MSVLRMITVGTPVAVELAELVMFSNELYEAKDALAKSLNYVDSNDELMSRHLVNAGVVAYFRCFMMNGNRKDLKAFIKWPDEFEPLHETMRAFRNKTVAHVDSGLKRTVVWLGVEDNGEQLAVRPPIKTTFHMDVAPLLSREAHWPRTVCVQRVLAWVHS
jgi:hypothetical protein